MKISLFNLINFINNFHVINNKQVKKYPTVNIYGISQNRDTNDFILVFHHEYFDNYCIKCDEKYKIIKSKWCISCKTINKNEEFDGFIKEATSNKIFELIPYDQFNDVKEIGRGGFATIYSATWKDKVVALKCLHDSQNISHEFLNEV